MIPDLPSFDYSSEEALQASAEARANTAMLAADAPLYFKGLPLKFTVSIKSLFFMLRQRDGSAQNEDERDERDTIILLYLMTQDPASWNEPVEKLGRLLQPLRSRPNDWLGVIDQWADATVSPEELPEASAIVGLVWSMHHATKMVPDDANPAPAEKKTEKSRGKSGSHPPPVKSSAGRSGKSAKKSR